MQNKVYYFYIRNNILYKLLTQKPKPAMTQNTQEQTKVQIQTLKSLASSIAHETRNPLATIKSACELIKGNLEDALEFLDLISISANRGLAIVDITLANIRNEEIDKSQFLNMQMSAIIKSVIREYAFESKTQRSLVNVDLDDSFDFKGDETLMIFVVFNLLKNAFYYRAKINIWMDSKTRTLHFKDDGIGIPADKLPYVFDDFMTSNKKGGTGLGLPFCKRVMKAFGGDICVKSAEGEGTEFYLKF
ncbi:MAG: two-component system autoinducer 1 sensor kinase/phosphatase LuxN [Rickettsiales bacterium]|jgi:two-component system autoinducer 1 sensor kinase/phosphatase LuxN